MTDILGYDPEDFVSSTMKDYFHPSDFARLLPYRRLCKTLSRKKKHARSIIHTAAIEAEAVYYMYAMCIICDCSFSRKGYFGGCWNCCAFPLLITS